MQVPDELLGERADVEAAAIVDVERVDVAVVEAYPVALATINVVAELELRDGFDEAAASAASTLVFTPATRNGAPIAAKIRFAVSFHGPVEVPAVSVALDVPGVLLVVGSLVVASFLSSPHAVRPSARAKMVVREVIVRIVRVTPAEIGVGWLATAPRNRKNGTAKATYLSSHDAR